MKPDQNQRLLKMTPAYLQIEVLSQECQKQDDKQPETTGDGNIFNYFNDQGQSCTFIAGFKKTIRSSNVILYHPFCCDSVFRNLDYERR